MAKKAKGKQKAAESALAPAAIVDTPDVEVEAEPAAAQLIPQDTNIPLPIPPPNLPTHKLIPIHDVSPPQKEFHSRVQFADEDIVHETHHEDEWDEAGKSGFVA